MSSQSKSSVACENILRVREAVVTAIGTRLDKSPKRDHPFKENSVLGRALFTETDPTLDFNFGFLA